MKNLAGDHFCFCYGSPYEFIYYLRLRLADDQKETDDRKDSLD